MPTPTYIPLATITLTSTDSEIVFSSIPATYRDLVVVCNVLGLTGTPTAAGGLMRLNSTNGSDVYMLGNGSSASSGTGTVITIPFQNSHGVYRINIMDYSATDKHKTVLARSDISTNFTWATAGRVATTSAITSVQLLGPDGGADQFIAGSTFSLFGIAG